MKKELFLGFALLFSVMAMKSYCQENLDKYELRLNPGMKYNFALTGVECGLSVEHPVKKIGFSLRRDFLFGFGRVAANSNRDFALIDFCSQTYFDILYKQKIIKESRTTFGVGFGLFTDALLAGMNARTFGSGTPPFENTYTKVISLSVKQNISWLTIELRGDIPLLPYMYLVSTSTDVVYPFSISLIYSFKPKKSN